MGTRGYVRSGRSRGRAGYGAGCAASRVRGPAWRAASGGILCVPAAAAAAAAGRRPTGWSFPRRAGSCLQHGEGLHYPDRQDNQRGDVLAKVLLVPNKGLLAVLFVVTRGGGSRGSAGHTARRAQRRASGCGCQLPPALLLVPGGGRPGRQAPGVQAAAHVGEVGRGVGSLSPRGVDHAQVLVAHEAATRRGRQRGSRPVI